MTAGVFYVTSIVVSLTGIAVLWEFGIKPLLLDNFRDSLFLLRDRLYLLAREGSVQHNEPAYRAVELLINSMIQYAHRFTFSSFILSSIWHDQSAHKLDHAANLFAAIDSASQPEVRAEMRDIVKQALWLLPRYIAMSSLTFLAFTGFYLVFRTESKRVASGKEAAVRTFTADAYESAKNKSYAHA